MTDLEQVQDALRYILAEDRHTWIRVGSALKTFFGDDGFDVWDSWSATAGNYEGRTMASQWKSIKAGKVSVGTIYHMAKQGGWLNNGQAPTHRPRARPKVDPVEQSRLEAEGASAAARQAQDIIGKSELTTHPYLEGKGFPDALALVCSSDYFTKERGEKRIICRQGDLVVPMRNPSGSLVCLQRIRTDGQKLFLAGARIKRAVHILGRGRERWVCEGYATALSLQAALDILCRDVSIVVTFAAHNLKSVARKGDRVVADHDRYRCGRCGAAWDDLTWPATGGLSVLREAGHPAGRTPGGPG